MRRERDGACVRACVHVCASEVFPRANASAAWRNEADHREAHTHSLLKQRVSKGKSEAPVFILFHS